MNDEQTRWLSAKLTTGRKAIFNTNNIQEIEEGDNDTIWIECGDKIFHVEGNIDDIIKYLKNGGIL